MKYILLMSTILLFGFSIKKENSNSFDHKLSTIASKFNQEIMDKDECENQKIEADDLSEDITSEIEKEDEYSSDEINKLKILKKEAEALEQYIAVIGNCGNNILSLENFYLANRRVGGGVLNVVKRKFCVDVISVTIGDYITYLGENNSSNNYTVTYRWKAPNGTYTGNGEMGLMKNCVRHIYNNRKEPKQKKITILSVACKAF